MTDVKSADGTNATIGYEQVAPGAPLSGPAPPAPPLAPPVAPPVQARPGLSPFSTPQRNPVPGARPAPPPGASRAVLPQSRPPVPAARPAVVAPSAAPPLVTDAVVASPRDGSLDATVAFEPPVVPSRNATERLAESSLHATADTMAADAMPTLANAPPASVGTAGGTRHTTVLPRIEGEGEIVRLVASERTRYESVKALGAGGMGEVVLVRDHDIDRTVAIKRLLPDMQHASTIARFVEEIHTVGQLEHPNIVPIHDVGVDEKGRFFFVMKFVDGETLESIIEKLIEGDRQYELKYSYEKRIEIFIGLLHALQFAHARGIVHRDIKPANVMVGRFGEVVLMDWGIARPIEGRELPVPKSDESAADTALPERKRAFRTRHGALIGTPAYMSPEQARGANAEIDVRSDLYSATVLFHEFVSLQHYLHHQETIPGMIATIVDPEPTKVLALFGKNAPAELQHFCNRGMQKKPEDRWQSADEMILELHNILEGRVRVQCHATMTKRISREAGRFVDRHPHLAFVSLVAGLSLFVFSVVEVVRAIV